MVGHAGSLTDILHADMTLTQSTVKIKVTGLLNFRKLPKPCVLGAMTVSPFWFHSLSNIRTVCWNNVYRRIFTARCNALIASAVLATAIPSVCPSVCHTPVLCQNDGT